MKIVDDDGKEYTINSIEKNVIGDGDIILTANVLLRLEDAEKIENYFSKKLAEK